MSASSRLRAILEHPHLTAGGAHVEELFFPEVHFLVDLPRVYALNSRTPVDHDRQLLVLLGDSGSPPEEFWKAVKSAHRANSAEVWVVGPHSAVPRVAGLRPVLERDALQRLFPIPPDLNDAVIANAENTVDLADFAAMQPRAATLFAEGQEPVPDVSAYLRDWMAAGKGRRPILMLGERGAGKSWTSLQFCAEQNAQLHDHTVGRGLPGPAFYVRLRDLMRTRYENTGVHDLATYLLANYPLSCWAGQALLHSMISSGYAAVCLDGFDEIDVSPDSRTIRNHWVTLAALIPESAKVIVLSRPSHFRSYRELLDSAVWSEQSVGECFEVLYLEPLTPASVNDFLGSLRDSRDPTRGDVARRIESLRSTGGDLAGALNSCLTHVGLLGIAIAELERRGDADVFQLIQRSIERGLVEYNLDSGRTAEVHVAGQDLVLLDVERRLAVTQDIAWYMAEREIDELPVDRIPPKIQHFYGISSDAILRDVRSQLVFEMVQASAAGLGDSDSALRFSVRARSEPGPSAATSSATGAFFVARYLAERLCEQDPLGRTLSLETRLAKFGSVRIGPICAAFLREHLRARDSAASSIEETLPVQALTLLLKLARSGDLACFSPRYRHVVRNLVDMGCLDRAIGAKVDPWSADVALRLNSPEREPRYALVFIPKGASGPEPFLLGRHEVTNGAYATFVRERQDWAVRQITRVGSMNGHPTSRFASKTNEYHLYFWMRGDRDSNAAFGPIPGTQDHPVTYVSWFAAAAYCDWLSEAESRELSYRGALEEKADWDAAQAAASDGYRLPTREEWTWVARAGYWDAVYPWDLFPYFLPKADRETIARDYQDSRYWTYQSAVRSSMLSLEKSLSPVLLDEINELGVSGLMGNVKEWCHDEESPGFKAILGATSYLGTSSFRFGYATPLFGQNTNPDVGFRVARSLSNRDLAVLHEREQEIAELLPAVIEHVSS